MPFKEDFRGLSESPEEVSESSAESTLAIVLAF